MIKKLLILFIVSVSLFAQSKVDSLYNSIKAKPIKEQVIILSDFCWRYRDVEPRLALHAGGIAANLAEEVGDKHLQSQALNYLGVIHRDDGAYEKSLGLSNYALQLAQSIEDKNQIAYSYNNISSIYRLMGNYPLAIETIYKALEIFESIGDKAGVAYCHYNLGLVYANQENFSKALENLELTAKYRSELGDVEGKIKALARIAEIYLQLDEDNKAKNIFNEAQNSFKNLENNRSLISIRLGFASLYKKDGNFQKAIIENKKALELAQKFSDVQGIVNASNELGLIYTQIGNYAEAKKYIELGKVVADEHNSASLKIAIYKTLSEFYEKKKDFANTLKFSKLYRSYQDSIYAKEKSSAISEVEAAYRISKKEKEKKLLELNLEKKQTQIQYALLIVLLLISVAIVSTILYFVKRKTSKQLQELNATKDKFFSIIAHDLKNPITSQFGLTSLMIEEYYNMKDEERLELIKSIDNAGKQTYKLLENLLYWSRSQTGRIEFTPKEFVLDSIIDEVTELKKEIAKAKGVTVERPEKSNTNVFCDVEMIKTSLRNLIANAIKFSYKGGKVSVLTKFEQKHVIISVVDEGVGLTQNQIANIFKIDKVNSTPGTDGERGSGLGLLLCKEFVEKNGGKIWIESEVNKGTKVNFTLPLA